MKLNLMLAIGIGVVAGIICSTFFKTINPATAQISASSEPKTAALETQIEALKHMLPDQAHAMTDVDYQFTNLWFAGQQGNWPLAEFYLNETRSHLNWAVRLRPVRKLSSGQDLDVAAILRGVENSSLAELKSAIAKQDIKMFDAGYRQTIVECYGCHKAAEKPYLRPQVPDAPATRVINMHPDADWPR